MGLITECTDLNVFITYDKMKQFLTGSILLIIALGAQAQTLETGLAINNTHLWQSNSYNDYVERTEGLGISAMARYQRPKSFFLFKNNEAGFEFSHGDDLFPQNRTDLN